MCTRTSVTDLVLILLLNLDSEVLLQWITFNWYFLQYQKKILYQIKNLIFKASCIFENGAQTTYSFPSSLNSNSLHVLLAHLLSLQDKMQCTAHHSVPLLFFLSTGNIISGTGLADMSVNDNLLYIHKVGKFSVTARDSFHRIIVWKCSNSPNPFPIWLNIWNKIIKKKLPICALIW